MIVFKVISSAIAAFSVKPTVIAVTAAIAAALAQKRGSGGLGAANATRFKDSITKFNAKT